MKIMPYTADDLPRTLIYKRTHVGDPDSDGRFGIDDCMGKVRARDFYAVVGVGGIGSEPRSHGIDGKINWIGLGAKKGEHNGRGPIVTFESFCLWDSSGPCFKDYAPNLAEYIYGHNVRAKMTDSLSPEERAEVAKILNILQDCPPTIPCRQSGARDSSGASSDPSTTATDKRQNTRRSSRTPCRR
jgi:hypothetical protein